MLTDFNKTEAKVTLLLSGTDPLHVAIETKDIEDPVGVHLQGIQSINHDNGRLCMGTILPRRRGRGSITWPIASSTAPPHWWTHAAAFVGWRAIALIIAMVTTS